MIELGLGDLGPVAAPSLHQAGIPEMAAVARRLGLDFPSRTCVLAVEVASPPTFGEPLSAEVRAALEPLRRRAREQVERWAREAAAGPESGPDGAQEGVGAGCTSTPR